MQNAHTSVNVVFVMQAGGMLSWRGSFGRLRSGDIHLMQQSTRAAIETLKLEVSNDGDSHHSRNRGKGLISVI